MAKSTRPQTKKTQNDKIHRVAVLDAGGQYIDLVRKAVERQGYPCDVLPLTSAATGLVKKYGAVVISGSPAGPGSEAAPMPDTELWTSGLPILGICYGMQSMAVANGGAVERGVMREDGRRDTNLDTKHPLFRSIEPVQTALFTHGYFVKQVPDDFNVIGQHRLSDGTTVYSAIARGNQVGVQFHPEVFDDTPNGFKVFENFLRDVAGLTPDPGFYKRELDSYITRKRKEIRKVVAGRHVIAFVSGGVDSSVALTLAATEIPKDHLHAYYIDHGFMREQDEANIKYMNGHGLDIKKVDAAKTFADATMTVDGETIGPLIDAVEPEHKRKLIGKTFIGIQNQLIADLELPVDEVMLLQGTNAADRITTGHSKGDKNTDKIKSHHNQVAEVQELKARGLLLEPIDDIFKVEVRAVGRELGLPYDLIERHPYPGPGLAVRVICTAPDQHKLDDPKIDKSVKEFVAPLGLNGRLLPVRTVGVGGDERSYLKAAALQGTPAWPTLSQLAYDIPSHFRDDINRVIFALTDKPIGNFSITPTTLASKNVDILRHAEQIAFEEIKSHDMLLAMTQLLIIMLPLSFDKKGERSIVLRPIRTSTYMTLQALLPERDLPKAFFDSLVGRIIKEVPGISQVFIDLTNKPPATTEWE